MLRLIPFLLISPLLAQNAWIPLFPEGAPLGAKPAVAAEAVKSSATYKDVAYRYVNEPGYQVFLPDADKRSGAAVVILPGGGYSMLAMGHEGYDYAKWLVQRGIVAVLVKYRVSTNDEAKVQFPVPLVDARRAIRVTRSKAKEWGVDPNKVGVIGSSAGGHLASMCATMAKDKIDPEPADAIDKLPCEVNFAILVYPVIGMDESWGHAGSRQRLIGAEPTDDLINQVATYRRVSGDTPPCFLVHAADDKVVPLRNTTEFAARCAEAGVAVVCHVYAHGGHGFGLSGKKDSEGWTQCLQEWLIFKGMAHAAESP